MITLRNTSTNWSVNVTPSGYKWSINSVNSSNSGRDTSGTMYPNIVTQKRKLELEFKGLTWRECANILQAVNSEHISVTYPDLLDFQTETRTFYSGDREMEAYTWWNGHEICASMTFNLIEI